MILEPFLSIFGSKILEDKKKQRQKGKRGKKELLYRNLRKNSQNYNGQLWDIELVNV